MRAWRSWRVAIAAAIAPFVLVVPHEARSNAIVGSISQVGAWKIGAYTVGQTTTFDHCSLYRVQSEGFGLAIGYSANGVWSMGAEAPDWGLTPSQQYTGTAVVGSASPFTFIGRAISPRALSFNVAPEIFSQLKSGANLTATANGKHYMISLDGIEAATQRLKECVKQYAAQTIQPQSVQPSAPTPASGSSALVTSIQVLLARLGYDPGPPNGVIGLKTNIAIAAFQKSQGERGDGLPSEALRTRLEKVVTERTAASAHASVPSQRSPAASSAPNGIDGQKQATSSGTGFYVGSDTIVTNHHVIAGCTEIHITKNGGELGQAKVVADSPGDDLAALRADVPSKSFLKLRIGTPIKPAESVLVFGYPLAGALSSAGNTTLGNVTALAGMRDDSRYIQISASVQPGNSGGPVVDEAGRLMGVVVAKLNATMVAMVTGDIPQNVNFAIKVGTLVSFLEAHNVTYQAADIGAVPALSNTDRAERAEASSAQLMCFK